MDSFIKKLSHFIPQYLTVEWTLYCKYVVCLLNTIYGVLYNTNVFNMSGMSRKVTNYFNEKLWKKRF